MAYIILNLVFLVLAVVMFKAWPEKNRSWSIALCILLILTAIFDSLIVGYEIVGYNSANILGIYIGRAPIEDFFYALLAVLLVPRVWNYSLEKER